MLDILLKGVNIKGNILDVGIAQGNLSFLSPTLGFPAKGVGIGGGWQYPAWSIVICIWIKASSWRGPIMWMSVGQRRGLTCRKSHLYRG